MTDKELSEILDNFRRLPGETEVVEFNERSGLHSGAVHCATYAEIEENEFNLNIPRYVDTFEPEPEIDIKAVQREIEEIEGKLVVTRKKMEGYLKEMGVIK
jgi:type I restriction-modification system DNA methylase subunit